MRCAARIASVRRVDVVEVVVDREAGASRGRQVVALHERLRTVMAGADGDPMPIEDLGEVVRMDSVHDEADDAGMLVGRVRAEPAEAADLPECAPRRLEEDALVRPHRGHTDALEVLDGRPEADRLDDRRRARLELPRHLVPLRGLEGHAGDHAAAGQERGHRVEQVAAAPERTDPRRAEHLVTGERREVDAQRRDVDRHVRDALCGVEDDDRADVVGARGDVGDRVDRAERVADVGQGDEPRAAGEESVEVVEVEPAVIGDRHVREGRAGRRGELLPRDEVGVVLHPGRDDEVARSDVRAAPAVRDEVQRLGGVSHEDDLAVARRADESRQGAARALEAGVGVSAELVDAAMDVGVVMGVGVGDGIDDRARLL